MLSPAQIAAQHRRRTRYSPAGLTVTAFLRKFPTVRWTLRAETGAIYHLWQHERLGWWGRSEILRGPDDLVRWRPIVSPLVLPLLDEEWLTLTFVEWPQDERLIATHPFLHVAGPIARLRAHVLDGWPGDPPVAHFLVEVP